MTDEMIEMYNEIQALEAIIANIGFYPCDPDALYALEQAKKELKEVRSRFEGLRN